MYPILENTIPCHLSDVNGTSAAKPLVVAEGIAEHFQSSLVCFIPMH